MLDQLSIIMETGTSRTHAALADRLRALRTRRGLTLDALAERSGVSRSMISLIERRESSPTAVVLDRLAAGLGVSLASLFSEDSHEAASPVVRRRQQREWQDPETGYLRRNLSPPGYPSPVELVEVVLPAGARVAYDSISRGLAQQIWILSGTLELTRAGVVHRLAIGDCLAMRVEGPIVFRNPSRSDTRYLLALAADVTSPGRA